ncbi:MAG: ATP-dependent endonuclease, partial [Planctomycetota bacterium]
WSTNLTAEVESELGEEWQNHLCAAYDYYGSPGGLRKNPPAIARALKSAWENGLRSTSLAALVEDIASFAKN